MAARHISNKLKLRWALVAMIATNCITESELCKDFAFWNCGERTCDLKDSKAISLELIDRPTKLKKSEVTAYLQLRVNVVNRTDQPVWIKESNGQCGAFEWVSRSLTGYMFANCDLRASCKHFFVIPPHGARTVSVPLGGHYSGPVGRKIRRTPALPNACAFRSASSPWDCACHWLGPIGGTRDRGRA